VEPLHRRPFIRDLDHGPVWVFDRGAAWCGEWVHDGVELGTDGGGEFAVQLPHAVPPLCQLQMAPVVLQLVIDRFWAVGVGGSDDGLGEPV
jgi:hypothetical protein